MVGSTSRGQVRLRSADPTTKPALTFNYFSDAAETDSMVAPPSGRVGWLPRRRCGASPHANSAQAGALSAVPRYCATSSTRTARPARPASERRPTVSSTHNCGRTAPGSVVPNASVFPTIAHGNTHAPSVLVGEKATQVVTAVG
ncbi:GMC oxidoreductase [Streptomyces sp. NPDC102415]|uniref:GMC oxidoreductase n=1 Tax=Streptomyces sp. NPDC102415 TaxID=3366173 RepID=UPI003806CBD0